VRPYFLLAWGHDGKHGVAGKLTPIRVVCKNTLNAAGFGNGAKWSKSADVYIRHYGDPQLNIDQARRALGLARKQVDATAEVYRHLAGVPVSGQQATRYIESVFPYPESVRQAADRAERVAMVEELLDLRAAKSDEATEVARQRIDDTRRIVAELLETGKGAELARGTAWGCYNAATEWVDHVYPVLSSGKVSAVRQQSVLFGAYEGVKERALTEALALA
jgi:phage/plasmid-like protein (TIGR03299 family)